MHNADRWKAYAKVLCERKKQSLYYLPSIEHPLQKRETMRELSMLARDIFN